MAAHKHRISPLLDRFEALELERLVLVHSYTELLVSPQGPAFQFTRYEKPPGGGDAEPRQNQFTPDRLFRIAKRFTTFATDAMMEFRKVHVAMGWGD